LFLLLQFAWITGKQQYLGIFSFERFLVGKIILQIVSVAHLVLLCPKLQHVQHQHTGMPTCKSGPG